MRLPPKYPGKKPVVPRRIKPQKTVLKLSLSQLSRHALLKPSIPPGNGSTEQTYPCLLIRGRQLPNETKPVNFFYPAIPKFVRGNRDQVSFCVPTAFVVNSAPSPEKYNVNATPGNCIMMSEIKEKCLTGRGCSAEEAIHLITANEAELFAAATEIREAFFGKQIELCCIINAKSGRCDMDCRFCSQSGHNSTAIEVYPFMDSAELEQQIRDDIKDGDRKCGVVTSGGKLSSDELKTLAETVMKIGGGKKAPVCGSLGRLNREDLQMLKDSGVTRFHHNLEASAKFYPEICSTQEWSSRLETVKTAQEIGLKVCSGGLFGLGESWQDRIDLAITLRELGVDSVPINFLYAHPGTPLKNQQPLSAEEALRIIAVYRFLLPDVTLRICGGRAHILGDRQKELFAAGANGLMTGNYLTVAGSQYESDLEMIRECGLEISAT